jgi:hypothetical protein
MTSTGCRAISDGVASVEPSSMTQDLARQTTQHAARLLRARDQPTRSSLKTGIAIEMRGEEWIESCVTAGVSRMRAIRMEGGALDADDGFVASSRQDSENEHIFVSNFSDHAFVRDNVELSAKLGVGDIEILRRTRVQQRRAALRPEISTSHRQQFVAIELQKPSPRERPREIVTTSIGDAPASEFVGVSVPAKGSGFEKRLIESSPCVTTSTSVALLFCERKQQFVETAQDHQACARHVRQFAHAILQQSTAVRKSLAREARQRRPNCRSSFPS